MDLSIATKLCKQFEGFRSKPYLCPAGIPTIGYGSTYYADGTKVTLQDSPITEEDAAELLEHELEQTYLPSVLKYCPGLETDNDKLNAIVDFCYNLGAERLKTSTLRTKINAQDWPGAVIELNKWTRGGGKILPGLVKRRQAEAALFS